MLGKKSSEKCAINVFLYSHEYRDQKMGGEKRAKLYSRNTLIVRAKNVGKKSSEKSTKNVFLHSHEYRDQKMGGKNARNYFSRNTLLVRAKNVGKKIIGKKCEKRFFIFTRIS